VISMLAFTFVLLAAMFLWIGVAFERLGSMTTTLLQWCRSFFDACLPYLTLAGTLFMWAATLLMGAGLVYALARACVSLYVSRRTMARLPVVRAARGAGRVALIRDDSLVLAFTHGLFRPVVYISTGLIKALERAELRAVFLHEAHHRGSRDPLRFFLHAFLKDLFFYVPIGAYLATRLGDRKETRADDAVIERTGDPLSLASALLKVARNTPAPALAHHLASIRGRRSGSVEERISRLVEERETRAALPGLRTVLASLAVAVVLVANLALSLDASAYAPLTCDTGHCSMHESSMAGGACSVHCEAGTGV